MRYWLVVLLASNVFAQPSGPLSSPRLVYSTYVGPGRTSAVLGIAVDSGGHVYAGGLGGGPGSGCAFLTKLNPGGTAALWSVCLPLTQVQAVALDAAGFVYVLGQSSGATNPATVLKLTQDGQPTSYSAQVEGGGTALALDRAGNVYIAGASRGGFVAKFSASGSLVYNAQLDLVGYPGPKAIAVDSKGRAWIAGNTCACPGGGG